MHRYAALAAAMSVALAAPALARATTFVVNTNDDLDGSCTAVHCSLRQAVNSANAAPGHDQIAFAIPPGGPQTIAVVGHDLPAITDPVTVDGTTQPGYAGSPIVELDGTADAVGTGGEPPSGLILLADGNTIRGLVINRFAATIESAGILANGSSGNAIAANYIGTDRTGTLGLGNSTGIRLLASPDNTIGGPSPADRNVVSANFGRGIKVEGPASTGNVIVGNFIGIDATGTAPVAQQQMGVDLQSPGNVVGEPGAATRNVISGNDSGVYIQSEGTLVEATGNVVQGNYIGTDATGTTAVANLAGVRLNGPGNLVGGDNPGDGNLISGNFGGVSVTRDGNSIVGNTIGLDADGAPLQTLGDGIEVGIANTFAPASTRIESNVIANSTGAGVSVVAGVRNGILSNSIFANGGLGIDLAPPGANPNDPGDADTGPNELQNAPVLAAATAEHGSTQVDGTLSSTPNTTFRLQLFDNAACDPTGFGEGQTLLGDRFVTTDATGTAAFSFGFAGTAAHVTATATDPDENTSEFSNCVQATSPATGSATTLSPPAATNAVGTTHTVTATVVAASTPAPLAGVTVHFTVTGSVATTGSCVTDGNGQCSFTYQGPQLPGADLITAYADANGNATEDANELPGAATKAWILPASTPGQVTGGGRAPALDGGISFGFTAQNQQNGPKGGCDVVDAASNVHVKCLSVTSLVVAGTHATFFGSATIDGVATNYRIDVDDLAEPGAGRDTFGIQTDTGFVAGGVLTSGNVQIHH